MPLTAGSRLGSYEIGALIGAGGMGEVYRAHDASLDRDVALKVLPNEFAADPDRLARFEREAKTLAALNHPHIAQIYGLERAGDSRALVMELVEGPTLAERIDPRRPDLSQAVPREGRPIPIDEVLSIARQIAQALEAAHAAGIVHRDLKPANIKVRSDGTVKVLDFGLAKAFEPGTGSGTGGGDEASSPTITSPAMTMRGVILGTAAYMAPEQAKGRAVDARADIWAFGCVLYEMLTRRRAFEGEDVSDTLAFVLTKEPDWTALPAHTPAALRRLLRRMLQKDPGRRLHDVADARIEIEDALTAPEVESGPSAAAIVAAPPPGWRRVFPWIAAAAGLAAAMAMLLIWAPWRAAVPAPVLRLEAAVGADAALVQTASGASGGASVTLSVDGTLLAFVGETGGRRQIYVRRLEQLEATPLGGTEGASNSLFFSPDGQWIGFFADGKLKKVSVSGGAAVTVADSPDSRGGSWGDDGNIVFAPNCCQGLVRVSSAGGKPEPVTTLGEGEGTHRWPQVLPGAKAVIYSVNRTNTTPFDEANIVVQPLPQGSPRIVQRGGSYGRYVPSGHLLYVNDRTLFAAPFDLNRLDVTGSPVPVIENVGYRNLGGGAQFSVSGLGTLAYLSMQGDLINALPLHWLDRAGKATTLRSTPANWVGPRLSPDGRRLAIEILDGQNRNQIWIYDWTRDALSRLTFGTRDTAAVWTPDGGRLTFSAFPTVGTRGHLYWRRADGTGEVQVLTAERPGDQFPSSWHPGGRLLAFSQRDRPNAPRDVMILPVDGSEASGWKPGKPEVFVNGPFNEEAPMFSPDGRWVAYTSDESGQDEIYVRPFPGPGGRWQVSTTGGRGAVWSRANREVLYVAPDQHIMAVSYGIDGDAFRAEKPRPWSDTRVAERNRFGNSVRPFDLHPDGQRVATALLAEAQPGARQDKVLFVFNFFGELRRLAPPSR